jgi:predicted nucleic acid-binding protein
MAYLLDTDVVIDHLANDPTTVQLLNQLAATGLYVSIVTYIEVVQGILLQPNPVANRAAFEAFLVNVPLLHLSRDVADRCAAVRADLTRRQRRVRNRAMDLLVAATALEHGLTLVTRNKADYQDITGLTLY